MVTSGKGCAFSGLLPNSLLPLQWFLGVAAGGDSLWESSWTQGLFLAFPNPINVPSHLQNQKVTFWKLRKVGVRFHEEKGPYHCSWDLLIQG